MLRLAQRRRRRYFDTASAGATRNGMNVLVLVLRGLSAAQAASRLPRSLGRMRQLHGGGAYTLASSERYSAVSVEGRRVLQALVLGSLGAGFPPSRADTAHSIWRLYRRWGYVSAYAEAGCSTSAGRALGLSLERSPPTDHVLTEPMCELDTQLGARAAGREANLSAGGPPGGAAACGSAHPPRLARAAIDLVLNYTRTFMTEVYASTPKLAVAVVPRMDGRASDLLPEGTDVALEQMLGAVLAAAPDTAVVLTSDVAALRPGPSRRVPAVAAKVEAVTTVAAEAAATTLHILLPKSAGSADTHAALLHNSRLQTSTLDAHATLRQLPMLHDAKGCVSSLQFGSTLRPLFSSQPPLPLCLRRLSRGLPPRTCSAHLPSTGSIVAGRTQDEAPDPSASLGGLGGCSLLLPIAATRSCADAMLPPHVCALAARVYAPALALAPGVASAAEAANPATSAASVAAVGSDPFAPPPHATVAAALRTLRCTLRAARARAAAAVATRAKAAAADTVVGGAVAKLPLESPTCEIVPVAEDGPLLDEVGAAADVFACDAPTFARITDSVLTLSCPASRLPMYSVGLNPKLHVYTHPVRLPNGTEYVAAYCRHIDFRGSACERLGNLSKASNSAALRRQCPSLSHGWVLDVAVANQLRPQVLLRARRKRRQRERAVRRRRIAAASNSSATKGAAGASSRGLGINVLMIMLDSISAARFKRGMPMTHALLEAWAHPTRAPHSPPAARGASSDRGKAGGGNGGVSNGWRSFRFDKFSVVGSNSPRNQLPMLSGLTSLEWERDHGGSALDCIVPGFPEVRASNEHTCDKWVFDAFKSAGYVTYFGTNMCDWGVMEEVYPFDTRAPPTDHHLMEPWCHVDYDVDKLYFRPMTRCLGGRPAHAPLMDYELQFLRNYAAVPRLAWSVYLEGHEPSFRMMGNLDADLSAHLLRLRAEHGENTAVLLLSDHGIHYGNYYDRASAGNQEHSLPLCYALLPRRLLADHPEIEASVSANQDRLVSPFDIHATLLHILSCAMPRRGAYSARGSLPGQLARAPQCCPPMLPSDRRVTRALRTLTRSFCSRCHQVPSAPDNSLLGCGGCPSQAGLATLSCPCQARLRTGRHSVERLPLCADVALSLALASTVFIYGRLRGCHTQSATRIEHNQWSIAASAPAGAARLR